MLAIASAGWACGARPSGTRALTWSPYAFVTESGDTVAAESARLQVPESRSDSGGRTVTLQVIRLPGSGQVRRPPVVYLAGGPGGSAIETARGARWPLFDALRRARDVILMDQRGTHGSDPYLLCPSPPDLPLSTTGTRRDLLRGWEDWSRTCVAALESRGIDLAAYDTRSAARDLDALRRGLAAPRISLVAISYGTQLAQAYARRYPRHVARIVLAGPEPLSATLKPVPQTEAQLARLDSAVQADPNAAARVGDFTALVRSVLNRLEREPAAVPVVDPVSGDSTTLTIGAYDVRFLTAFGLGDRRLMLGLPALYLAMRAGDFSRVAPLVLRLRRYNTTAMAATTDCATGWSAADSASIARAAPDALLEDAANFPYPDICSSWPHRDLGPSFRADFRSDASVLFVAGTMDGRTPPSNVNVLASEFPDHRRLIIRGGSHDDDLFLSSPDIIPAIVRFVRSGAAPPRAVIALPPWRFPLGG